MYGIHRLQIMLLFIPGPHVAAASIFTWSLTKPVFHFFCEWGFAKKQLIALKLSAWAFKRLTHIVINTNCRINHILQLLWNLCKPCFAKSNLKTTKVSFWNLMATMTLTSVVVSYKATTYLTSLSSLRVNNVNLLQV